MMAILLRVNFQSYLLIKLPRVLGIHFPGFYPQNKHRFYIRLLTFKEKVLIGDIRKKGDCDPSAGHDRKVGEHPADP